MHLLGVKMLTPIYPLCMVLLFENSRGGGGMLDPDKFCLIQISALLLEVKLILFMILHSGLDQRVGVLLHFCRN